jgi:hypothetical protein
LPIIIALSRDPPSLCGTLPSKLTLREGRNAQPAKLNYSVSVPTIKLMISKETGMV